MSSQPTAQTSHDGKMLKHQVEQSKLTVTQAARLMGVAHSTLLWYFDSPNLRTLVLWKAAKMLRHNFFYDIGMALPADYSSAINTEHTRRIAELEKENERLRIENETYQKILQR